MARFSAARYGILGAACAIFVLQAGASRMFKVDEQAIPTPGLHSLPRQVGQWNTTSEMSMDAAQLEVLKPDEYIMRDYADGQTAAPINVFVAYFKSLQNTYGPHSPSVCLPGAGWLVSSSKILSVPVDGRSAPIQVNEYTMEKSTNRMLVLYWYQNDRDTWAEEFHAKLRLLPDLLRYHRSDVSLVRLITTIQNSSPDAELSECLHFTGRLYPLLAERFASVH
jgi:EpsI family protein